MARSVHQLRSRVGSVDRRRNAVLVQCVLFFTCRRCDRLRFSRDTVVDFRYISTASALTVRSITSSSSASSGQCSVGLNCGMTPLRANSKPPPLRLRIVGTCQPLSSSSAAVWIQPSLQSADLTVRPVVGLTGADRGVSRTRKHYGTMLISISEVACCRSLMQKLALGAISHKQKKKRQT